MSLHATERSLIQISDLADLQKSYRDVNKGTATNRAAMTKAQQKHKGLYDNKPGSLGAKMKAIRKATCGQYWPKSTQFAAVNNIKL